MVLYKALSNIYLHVTVHSQILCLEANQNTFVYKDMDVTVLKLSLYSYIINEHIFI